MPNGAGTGSPVGVVKLFGGCSGAEKRWTLGFLARLIGSSVVFGGDSGALFGGLYATGGCPCLLLTSPSLLMGGCAVLILCEYIALPFTDTTDVRSFVMVLAKPFICPGLLLPPFSKLPRIVPFTDAVLVLRAAERFSQLPLERPLGTTFSPELVSVYMPALELAGSPFVEDIDSVGVLGGVVS